MPDILHETVSAKYSGACSPFVLVRVIVVGSGGLRAPHVVVDGSEAGHCFHVLFEHSKPF